MWTIRQQQLEVFRANALQKFETEMVGHLTKLFPQLSKKLGDPGLRVVISHGVKRAREYGIVRKKDVGRYIAVMLMFGPDFDRKKTSGPLCSVMRDPRLQNDPNARVAALCKAALWSLKTRTRRTGKKPNW
jgi:hypothetical protein